MNEKEPWETWKEKVWESMKGLGPHGGLAGLAAFEQYALRSNAEKRCIDCGAPGVVKVEAGKYCQAVKHYWVCQNCHDFWQRKKE